jgi:alanyl-tRNA synthetase
MTKVRAEELPERISKMMERLKAAEKEIAKARTAALTSNIESLVGEAVRVGEVRCTGSQHLLELQLETCVTW